jgi:YegS/Rv2252/BmrU family lipid kinase
MANDTPKILFFINPGSGNNKTDWKTEITSFFSGKEIPIEIVELPNPCDVAFIRKKIKSTQAEKIVAVGGDGTIKLIGESMLNSGKTLGILPAGSANGMARELGIPTDPADALEVLLKGEARQIHLIKVNDELCIHLSDIGFNALVVKKFEEDDTRGMKGYLKATWNVLWQHRKMKVDLQTDNENVLRYAVMVVIANATKYGNGVVINPEGSLYDDLFEVVIVRKISFAEILKMRFGKKKQLNPKKTELFQTRSLKIVSKHYVHFQVDGETMGKIKEINAELLATRLTIITPKAGSA